MILVFLVLIFSRTDLINDEVCKYLFTFIFWLNAYYSSNVTAAVVPPLFTFSMQTRSGWDRAGVFLTGTRDMVVVGCSFVCERCFSLRAVWGMLCSTRAF